MKIRQCLFIFACFFGTAAVAQDFAIDEIMKEARTVITKDLKDPVTAQFRGEFIRKFTNARGKDVFIVCGEVNAKNSYGGYVGFAPYYFASTGKTGRIRNNTNAEVFDGMYAITCKNEKEGMELITIPDSVTGL